MGKNNEQNVQLKNEKKSTFFSVANFAAALFALAYAGSGYLLWKFLHLASMDLLTVLSGIVYLLLIIGVLYGIFKAYSRIKKWIDAQDENMEKNAWTSILSLSSVIALLGIGWGLEKLMYLLPLKEGFIFFGGVIFAAEMVVVGAWLFGIMLKRKKKSEQ